MKRRALILSVFLLCAAAAFGQVRFNGLDLTSDNRLLFEAEVSLPEFGSYQTLFRADVAEKSLKQLTYFPEHLTYLQDAGVLQIQNRFGVFRSDRELDDFGPIQEFPAFVNGAEIETGEIAPIQASPDGRYLVYLRRQSPAYADLVLHNVESGEASVVSEEVPISLSGPPVRWSPNSAFFVYEKQGRLYYYSVDELAQDRVLAESFRDVGSGSIRSVRWGERGDLYYVSESLVYRIQQEALFARSFYEDLLSVGDIVGKIPFSYDPNFDRFWISPAGGRILFNKGGRNLFLYVLQSDDFQSTGDTLNLPYLYLPRNTEVRQAVWSELGTVTVLAESFQDGETRRRVYRFRRGSGSEIYRVQQTDDEQIRGLSLSPDGSHAALLLPDRVVIKAYEEWETVREIDHEAPLHLIWIDNESFVVAGRAVTERVNWREESSELLALSQVDEYGFGSDGTAQAAVQDRSFAFDRENSRWTESSGYEASERNVASDQYRVYTEQQPASTYRNLVMVRSVEQTGTTPLFPRPETEYEAFPDQGEASEGTYFSHGSRLRRREVSLVFNATGSVEGLRQVLNTLSAYDVRATFFLNGDFIRRHPGAANEIAQSGHEVGSLFFTYFDMTDTQYRITEQFIRQGLGRTEDIYFQTTDRELSLLWHAPYYFVNETLIQASEAANYSYVGRDVDSLDWVPKSGDPTFQRLYEPSASLVERVLEKKQPGSIVSLTIGKPRNGDRDDYLFQYLDLLISRLMERGYSVVPVSILMEHAR